MKHYTGSTKRFFETLKTRNAPFTSINFASALYFIILKISLKIHLER